MLFNKKVLIIINGSIAAYKALYLIRLLKQRKCVVNCVMTESSKRFITPLSVSSLSGNKVYDKLFDLTDEVEMGHIKLSRLHDFIIVVPASANFLSKVSLGLADDLASTLILATKLPTFYFPAMNTNMWENSIIKENIKKIRTTGQIVVQGEKGDLACGENGYGRLADPDYIIKYLDKYLQNNETIFEGVNALVTAGPTIEPIDPVRFISNRSSGIQGYAIAEELAKLGADVSLITGPTSLENPKSVKKIYKINTAVEMYEICKKNIPRDLFISVAAVTDWKTKSVSKTKIKKSCKSARMDLIENPDILKYISLHPNRPRLVVGFAAETNSLAKNARLKLVEKNCDLLVANNVAEKDKVFGSYMNAVHIYNKKGIISKIRRMSKESLSKKILKDYIYPLLNN